MCDIYGPNVVPYIYIYIEHVMVHMRHMFLSMIHVCANVSDQLLSYIWDACFCARATMRLPYGVKAFTPART